MVTYASPITPEIETLFAGLRSSKGLSIVPSEREGTALGKLPDNIYGFTGSPVNSEMPLWARRNYQSFEVHKLAGGVVHLLGFVTPEEAASIRDGRALAVNLYPEPYEAAQSLVQIAVSIIKRAKPVSRIRGNYMPLELESA